MESIVFIRHSSFIIKILSVQIREVREPVIPVPEGFAADDIAPAPPDAVMIHKAVQIPALETGRSRQGWPVTVKICRFRMCHDRAGIDGDPQCLRKEEAQDGTFLHLQHCRRAAAEVKRPVRIEHGIMAAAQRHPDGTGIAVPRMGQERRKLLTGCIDPARTRDGQMIFPAGLIIMAGRPVDVYTIDRPAGPQAHLKNLFAERCQGL